MENQFDNNKNKSEVKSLTRANRLQISRVKDLIKNDLSLLKIDHVQKYKLRNCDAILLELEKSGSTEAVELLKEIFLLDEQFKSDKKSLKKHFKLIERLKNCLLTFELAKKEEKPIQQASILLENAVFFNSTNDFKWIAEKLIEKCLLIVNNIENDDEEALNITRFIQCEFLFEENKHEEALICLEKILSVCESKKWSISKLLKHRKQSNLFRECNTLLYKIHLVLAEKFETTDAEIAAQHLHQALQAASNADYEEYVCTVLHKFGEFELARNNLSSALKLSNKFLSKARRTLDYESICKAHKLLAQIHLGLKNDKGARQHLESFRIISNEFNLPKYFAEANFLSGEYFLSKDRTDLACHFYRHAFEIYKSLGLENEMNCSLNLLEISSTKNK